MTVPPAIADPDRMLALGYVPLAIRPAMTALFALDERFAGIVARTTEPTVGLMRLIWWRDALDALDRAPPPAEPLLGALSGCGIAGAALAAMTPGWEALLDEPDLDDATIALHASERGSRLFGLAGGLLGIDRSEPLERAGAGWALVDLARHLDRPPRAAEIRARARTMLDGAFAARWPRALRPLGQLAALARDEPAGPRRRALRVLRHQLTGR